MAQREIRQAISMQPTGMLRELPRFGLTRWFQPSALDQHAHEDFEIHLFVRGEQSFLVDGHLCPTQPGQLLVVPPGIPHGPASGMAEVGDCWWLIIRLTRTDPQHDALRQALDAAASNGPLDGDERIEELMAELAALHEEPEAYAALLAQGLLWQLIGRIGRLAGRAGQGCTGPSPAISAAIRALHDYGPGRCPIERLAEAAGLGLRRFHDRFRSETGYTPAEFRLRHRLQQATAQLADSRRSITDIALDLGFSSSQNFATVFRRHIGYTPSAWRAEFVDGLGRSGSTAVRVQQGHWRSD